MSIQHTDPEIQVFLQGKSEQTMALYQHFLDRFSEIGDISLHATKTMIGISNGNKRIAWVTQLGKNFIHVVFPFREPYLDNLCFTKVGQVPGATQFNHHFRMYFKEDVNDEVFGYMCKAYEL